jgi:hypothetical protein
MTKWKYKWVRPSELSPQIMDELGDDGWEFVGELGGDWTVFKRPDLWAMNMDHIDRVRRQIHGVRP